MIIRGSEIETKDGRKPYPLAGQEIVTKHFVIRETTPDTPFRPHRHEQPELWFILEGEAIVSLDGRDHTVYKGDLIVLAPHVEHGLRVERDATWICLG